MAVHGKTVTRMPEHRYNEIKSYAKSGKDTYVGRRIEKTINRINKIAEFELDGKVIINAKGKIH